MKNVFLKSVLVLTAVLFFITGCSNFLGGSDIKRELEKEIIYNSENPVELLVFTNNGSIVNSGTHKVRKSDRVSIEWNKNNSDYNFIKWICEPKDSVQFVDDNNKNSISNSKTTILVNSTDTAIKVYPLLYKVSPDFSNAGTSCDTSISITFNNDINSSYFEDLSNINFNSSQNTHYKNELKSLFTLKSFIDKRNLVINPNGTSIVTYMDNDNTFDFYVYINKDVFQLPESCSDLLVGNFRYNKKRDNQEPEIKSLDIYSNEAKSRKLTDKIFSDWADEDYNQNHVKSIFLKCSLMDEDSGLDRIVINETLIQGVDGTSRNTLKQNNQTISEFSFVGKEIFESNFFEYKFNSSEDGIVKLEIIFYDRAGNFTTSTYYVVKDTIATTSNEVNLFNHGGDSGYFENWQTTAPCTLEYITELVKEIYITNLIDDEWALGKCTTVEELINSNKIYIKYGTDINNLETQYLSTSNHKITCTNYSPLTEKDLLFIKLNNLSTEKDNYIFLYIEDAVGNVTEVSRTLPAAPIIFSSSYEDNYTYLFLNKLVPTELVYYTTQTQNLDKANLQFTLSSYGIDIGFWNYKGTTNYNAFTLDKNFGRSGEGKVENILYSLPSNWMYCTNDIPSTLNDGPVLTNVTLVSNGPSTDSHSLYADISEEDFNKYSDLYAEAAVSSWTTFERNPITHAGTNLIASALVTHGLIDYGEYSITIRGKLNNIPCKKSYDYTISDIINNQGPYMGEKFYIYNKKAVLQTPYFWNNENNFVYNHNHKVKMTVYYVPYPKLLSRNFNYINTDFYKLLNFTNEYIKSQPYVTAYFDPTAETFEINLPEMDNGDYILYENLTDKNGNELLEPICAYKVDALQKPDMVLTNSSTTLTTSISQNKFKYGANSEIWSNYNQYYTLEVLNTDTNEWEKLNENEFLVSGDIGTEETITFTNSTFSNKTSFARYTVTEQSYKASDTYSWTHEDSEKGIKVTTPVYFPTLHFGGRSGTVLTKNEDGSYSVMFSTYSMNSRVLAQVLYSKNNHGNNPDKWEYFCSNSQKINPRVLQSYDTYSSTNFEDVPSGNYYTLLIHNGDGTTTMTNPVYKQ